MASSFPIAVVGLVVMVLVFETAAAGSTLADENFDDFSDQDCSSFFEAIGCVIDIALGAIGFFFDLVTINVDGAPWWVRVPFATVLGGAIFWAFASLARGGS